MSAAIGTGEGLGWLGIFRLGLVQTALGAIVVLTTSAINRVMVVELALPATLPGVLVAVHYAVQILRPRMGYGSDMGGQRTPWIIGGMAVLAIGGIGAAAATALMASAPTLGLMLAIAAFLLIGIGVGAAGTSLLVLLAAVVAERRRPAAASIVWIMMIAGFVVTTAIAGRLLDPYSGQRLIVVASGVSALAFLLAVIAVWGIEARQVPLRNALVQAGPRTPFRQALGEVWAEPDSRRFTVFVFVSMLAYSAQDLVLEPFAGQVFGLSLGETTSLASIQHGGVLAGMIVIAMVGIFASRTRFGTMRGWTIGGCAAATLAMLMLVVASQVGPGWPLGASFFVLGLANGVFAAAAIASMMLMVGKGRERREGVRMGMWGAAQAIAFGLGSLAGAVALDLARLALAETASAYAAVFLADALLFGIAGLLALRIGAWQRRSAVTFGTFPPGKQAVGG
ncbi:BCD family MFS transporter [Elioraea sp.]|uniref:BCD family MFS transporter n=1 Tax=Elioraea sp. TaxID=2185103 RepID=UPI0025C0AA30|nr:BCD family MFS transporter [Elioraea sp.]